MSGAAGFSPPPAATRLEMRAFLSSFTPTMSTLRLIIQPLAIAVALAFAVRASKVGIYTIPSSSMESTLQVGDTIVVTPYVSNQEPQRGDIVVFHSPTARDEMVVKRVAATPGDLIETREGHLIVCGHAVAEPYASATTVGIAPQIIPAKSCFVLGDNRANSYDSRQWGVIADDLVVGRARVVLRKPALHGLHLAAFFKLER